MTPSFIVICAHLNQTATKNVEMAKKAQQPKIIPNISRNDAFPNVSLRSNPEVRYRKANVPAADNMSRNAMRFVTDFQNSFQRTSYLISLLHF